jgi:hypothetical protein
VRIAKLCVTTSPHVGFDEVFGGESTTAGLRNL